MLLPVEYLDTVVSLRTDNLNESDDVIGTGLFYAYPRVGSEGKYPDDYATCLVTCAHVVKNLKVSIRLGLNVNSNKHEMLNGIISERDSWICHPTADVAVVPINLNNFRPIRSMWGLPNGSKTIEQMNADGVVEGTDVLMFGFPVGWRKGRQDYPIVRRGTIAQIQGLYHGDHDTFLVDGSGFPGNSGGPVIISPIYAALGTELKQRKISGRTIGIVSGRRFSPIEISPYSDVQVHAEETADLVEVIPMDRVHETIEHAMRLRSQGV